jgi:DNA-binding transcriptional regulator YdaS (Cro superfamily)
MTDVAAAQNEVGPELEFARLMSVSPDEVSPEMNQRTRKIAAVVLQKLNAESATLIAQRMGVHDSALSRWKTQGALMFMARALAALGLKVVPADAVVYLQPEEFK